MTPMIRDANTLYMIQPLDSVPLLLLGILACIVQTTLALRASNVFGRRKVLKKLFIGSMLFLIAVCWLGNVGECSGWEGGAHDDSSVVLLTATQHQPPRFLI